MNVNINVTCILSHVCVYTQRTRSVYLMYNYAKSAISDHVKKTVKVSDYGTFLVLRRRIDLA